MPRWFPVRVAGDSMRPTLAPGDVLAVREPRAGEPRVGQIVIWRRPERESIKRVAEPPRAIASGHVWLEGDDPARSTDSRTLGPVPVDDIVGVVRARYRPVRRARLFR